MNIAQFINVIMHEMDCLGITNDIVEQACKEEYIDPATVEDLPDEGDCTFKFVPHDVCRTKTSLLNQNAMFHFSANILYTTYTDLIVRFVHDHCKPQGMALGSMASELQSRVIQLFNIALGMFY